MERIQEALERARQERGTSAAPPIQTTASSGAGQQIAYQATRSVEIPRHVFRENRIVAGFGQDSFTDANKMLCTQVLQRLREKGWNALAVTSPGQGEGRTLTAINLSVGLAREVDWTVLLVDANLRNPAVHHYFKLNATQGLGDYLVSNIALENILLNPSINNFVILPGGKILNNSAEMLGSPKMADLVQELKSRYPSRIVIFDLPPLLSAADALAFAPYIDAVLLVVEEGRTRRDDLLRAQQLLGSERLLGIVMNKSRPEQDQEGHSGGRLREFFRSYGR